MMRKLNPTRPRPTLRWREGLSAMLRLSDGTVKRHVRVVYEIVGKRYGYSVENLMGDQRHRRVVKVRHMAWWILWSATGWTTSRIAKSVNRADHTVILYGLKQHRKRMREQPSFRKRAVKLLDEFKAELPKQRGPHTAEATALREVWEDRASVHYVP